ncbi:lysine-specific demethylase 5A isoform X1 [Hydra vulgaris]|uniref:lysine-specific demethylase 5A isoform X1 n=1 Tax=Hydra vulgaris TaxID=6087 RepID=UPI0006414473|nr:lysine-specific demethylase 5A isoform X1 [Hydra vulgaris]
MYPNSNDMEFIQPPEAPIFEPDEEEWKDPLGFIAKIYPYVVKVGICKIRPPPDWQPTFSVDVEKFRFTPRIQRLHELEAKTRVKLNFFDTIAKFWELQGSCIKLPNIEKKPLDLHELHKIVQTEGGYEDVTRLRRWSRIALLMGYSSPQASAILRRHYEKILYPYDVFMSGAMIGESNMTENTEFKDRQEEKKNSDVSSNNSRHTRQSKYKSDSLDNMPEVNFEANTELKKLQFLAPGPKIAGTKPAGRTKRRNKKYEDHFVDDSELSAIQGQNHSFGNDKNIFSVVASWQGVQDYRCNVCEFGDEEHCMLLCDSCDSSYHSFCLIPPLQSVPPGDWRCPKCVAKECSKPTEAFGFEQAKKVYSLQSFGEMADKFKEDYFSMPPHEVPLHVVEKEFWRLVHSIDENLCVEYGADLHTKDLGSGFPLANNTDNPEDQVYIDSPWNLNNLANNDKSVLKFITQDISGMKVPWLYIGMCFSSFCWHTEDHWSYSINYCHWGEPKTWYGVPASEAEKLENCVKSIAPELFEKNPDLLHHLVTTCSPMTLMNYGVPVFRTDQHAGEFIITFPRAYHAGFNQGYNCAEAVNFCPADWLSIGFDCIEHYRKLQRAVVFSHEELVCKMASVPEALDLDIAKKLYENLKLLVDIELSERASLHEKGIKDSEFCPYELISDDERQCDYCKCTLYFSAVVCSCDNKRLSCLKHPDEICVCQNIRKFIRYRYTLNELPELLSSVKKRADSFDNWEKQVQKILSCSSQDRYDVSVFKELINESEQNNYPDCELLEQLKSTIVEADQCSQVAIQFIAKKHKTRKSSSIASSSQPRLTLEELNDFVLQVKNLPCIIKEAKAIDILMQQIENFQHEAHLVLNSDNYNEPKVLELIEHGNSMDVELPELNELKMDLKASKWLGEIVQLLNQEEPVSLDVMRTCVDQGIGLKKKPVSIEPLSRLKELLFSADRWEEKAKLCLQAKPRHMISTLDVIVQEASKVRIILPNVSMLRDALNKAKEWTSIVERMQNDDYYPYYDVLDTLVSNGRPIPVRLEQLSQMESQVAAARAWKERTSRIFLKKGSEKSLLEVIRPRKDVGVFDIKLKLEKKSDESDEHKKFEAKKEIKKDACLKEEIKMECDDKSENEGCHSYVDEYISRDPNVVMQALKLAEKHEIEAVRKLRCNNRDKLITENIEGPYCFCRKPIDGLMVPCSLCLEWYHTTCIVAPKTVYGKPIGKGFTACSVSREVHYLCPECCRTRRPRIDAILSLLMSLQKLPVRIPEGEALQFLTERAMNWQDRTKVVLSHPEIQRVIDNVKRDIELVEKHVSHLLLIQRLLAVKKLVKYEKQLNEDVKLDLNQQSYVKPETIDIDSSSMQPLETKPLFAESGLECTEKMCNQSPNSKENFDNSFSNHTFVQIQSSNSPSTTYLNDINVSNPDRNELTMLPLPNSVLNELDVLLYEGSILEVGLDEVEVIWAILQIQRPLLKEECMIMNAEYRRNLAKKLKKQRKRKSDDSKQTVKAVTNLSIVDGAAVKKLKDIVSRRKKNEKLIKIRFPINIDKDEDEDDCSAKPCLKPLGEEVEWVMCDTCNNWYHCACVRISAQEAINADEYKCPYCKTIQNDKIQKNAPGLTIMAELAHHLIKVSPVNKHSDDFSDKNISHISELDSLLCLANASQSMNFGPLGTISPDIDSMKYYDSKDIASQVNRVIEAPM